MTSKRDLIECLSQMPEGSVVSAAVVLELLTTKPDPDVNYKDKVANELEWALQSMKDRAKSHALIETRIVVPQDMRMVAAMLFSRGSAETMADAAYKVLFEKKYMAECGEGFRKSSGF